MSKKPFFANLLVLLGAVASAHGQTLTPNRSHLMAPQPVAEPLPTRDGIARRIADGSNSPAEITAANIMIDEARKSAVRYLATVDCHYYPEAELSLIAALRADCNEAVRLEAAVALGTCRGTTRKIVEALSLTALGLETDGNPSETSERVRQAARYSLDRVMTSGVALYPVDHLFAVQPTAYSAPIYPITPPPASPKEREIAETVSTPSRKSVSSTTTATPRSLVEWLQNYTGASHRNANGAASQNVDPRLRGLTPLGSGSTLAIPNLPAHRTARPYN